MDPNSFTPRMEGSFMAMATLHAAGDGDAGGVQSLEGTRQRWFSPPPGGRKERAECSAPAAATSGPSGCVERMCSAAPVQSSERSYDPGSESYRLGSRYGDGSGLLRCTSCAWGPASTIQGDGAQEHPGVPSHRGRLDRGECCGLWSDNEGVPPPIGGSRFADDR